MDVKAIFIQMTTGANPTHDLLFRTCQTFFCWICLNFWFWTLLWNHFNWTLLWNHFNWTLSGRLNFLRDRSLFNFRCGRNWLLVLQWKICKKRRKKTLELKQWKYCCDTRLSPFSRISRINTMWRRCQEKQIIVRKFWPSKIRQL